MLTNDIVSFEQLDPGPLSHQGDNSCSLYFLTCELNIPVLTSILSAALTPKVNSSSRQKIQRKISKAFRAGTENSEKNF